MDRENPQITSADPHPACACDLRVLSIHARATRAAAYSNMLSVSSVSPFLRCEPVPSVQLRFLNCRRKGLR